MNNDPLAALRDIHLPQRIDWWPLAPGWYVVILIVILTTAIIGFFAYKKYQRYKKRKHIEALLQTILTRYRASPDSCDVIAELAVYLKRLVMTYYPQHCATLTGNTWLRFLDKISESNAYTEGVGKLLLTAPYQKQAPDNSGALIRLIESTTHNLAKHAGKITYD